MRLAYSIKLSIREGLTTTERWSGTDKGLIWCWERGRQKRSDEPTLAHRASQGELVPLAWRKGTLNYLATWQGLRGEDLDISLDEKVTITCSVTNKPIVFSGADPAPEDGDVAEL